MAKKHPLHKYRGAKCPQCGQLIGDTTCCRCHRKMRVGQYYEHPRMMVSVSMDDECDHLVTCGDYCAKELANWAVELLENDDRVRSINVATYMNGGRVIQEKLTPQYWNLN